MNKKRGFTLVELIVSFVLITVISLAFFRTVLVLQEQQLENIASNKFKTFTMRLNSLIQNDFLNDKIESINRCGINCYEIVYLKKGEIILEINNENDVLSYGEDKEEIPKDYKVIDNMELTSYKSDLEGYNSYIVLNMKLKSNYSSKIENIKYMYQYDSNIDEIELDLEWNGAAYIKKLLSNEESLNNGLKQTYVTIDGKEVDAGIRYVGSSPNNYVYFNCEDEYQGISYGKNGYNYSSACELWRIIGVFDVERTVDGEKITEKRIKIVRDEVLSEDMEYGIGESFQWGGSDIEKYLNTEYYQSLNTKN